MSDWFDEIVARALECPECANRVIGTLPGGVRIGPEAVGRAWPKHYKRTEATGCPHSGADHPIEARDLHQEATQ